MERLLIYLQGEGRAIDGCQEAELVKGQTYKKASSLLLNRPRNIIQVNSIKSLTLNEIVTSQTKGRSLKRIVHGLNVPLDYKRVIPSKLGFEKCNP